MLFKDDAEQHGDDAQGNGGDLGHPHLLLLVGPAVREHVGVQVVRDRRGTGQGQTGHHRQNRGEGDRRDEAEQQIAAHRMRQVDRRHVLPALNAADRVGIQVFGIAGQQHDGTEAHQEGQDVEVTDPAGGVEHRLAGFDGAAHGEKAHQDMRQAGGAEHQRQAQRDRLDRVVDQGARPHDGETFVVDVGGFLEHHFGIHAPIRRHVQRAERDDGRTGQQQDSLDDLHPGGGQHAAEGDVHDDQDADDDDRVVVR